jgi:hypothetical protein
MTVRAEVAPLPGVLHRVKTPLQRAIQLLKRQRDIGLNGDDGRPVSIAITMLGGHAYEGEDNVFDALTGLVTRMEGKLDREPEGYHACYNPVNRAENFGDKWRKHTLTGLESWSSGSMGSAPPLLGCLPWRVACRGSASVPGPSSVSIPCHVPRELAPVDQPCATRANPVLRKAPWTNTMVMAAVLLARGLADPAPAHIVPRPAARAAYFSMICPPVTGMAWPVS